MSQEHDASLKKGGEHHYGEHLVEEIKHFEEEVEHTLGKEYEHTVVLLSARRRLRLQMDCPVVIKPSRHCDPVAEPFW